MKLPACDALKVVRGEYRAWGPVIAAHGLQTAIVISADIEDAIAIVRERWMGRRVEFTADQMRERHSIVAEKLIQDGASCFNVERVEFVSATVVGDLSDSTEPTSTLLRQSDGNPGRETFRVYDCLVEIMFAHDEEPGWAGTKALVSELVLARHLGDVLQHWHDIAARSGQAAVTSDDGASEARLESATLLNATSIGEVYAITEQARPKLIEIAACPA